MPEFTGERVVPGEVDPDLFNEHFSRYAFAQRFARHRRVLDLGCGTGYGAAALAEAADHVTAVDSSVDALEYARTHYSRPNLAFELGDATEPRQMHFDLITAFEVIEHLEHWPRLLHNVRDCITDAGLFLVSTPNKPVYAESRGSSGVNPFHQHEFEYEEFRKALSAVFPYVAVFVQNHSAGVLFAPVEHTTTVEAALADARVQVEQANFYLAVCAIHPLAHLETFFWIASTTNVLQERDRHIELLAGEVQQKTRWMAEGRAELNTRNLEYDQLLKQHRSLLAELEERNRWALGQNELLRERGERIQQLQAELETGQQEFGHVAAEYEAKLADLEKTNVEKTHWALETEHRLTAELQERGAELARAVELLHAAERKVEERTLWAQSLDLELREWQAQWSALRGSAWVRAGHLLRAVPDRT